MQNVIDAPASLSRRLRITNIPDDAGEIRPTFRPDLPLHIGIILRVPGREIIQTDHLLPEKEKRLNEIRADEAG